LEARVRGRTTPDDPQVPDVVARDLIGGRVAREGLVAPEVSPVDRLSLRVQLKRAQRRQTERNACTTDCLEAPHELLLSKHLMTAFQKPHAARGSAGLSARQRPPAALPPSRPRRFGEPRRSSHNTPASRGGKGCATGISKRIVTTACATGASAPLELIPGTNRERPRADDGVGLRESG